MKKNLVNYQKAETHNDFFEKVYIITREIPYGKVTTYGAIAKAIGIQSSARMVGLALKMSVFSNIYVPAHRVVNRNGYLTGKHGFHSPTLMQELLENEGIKVENDRVVNFKKYFWDPVFELKI